MSPDVVTLREVARAAGVHPGTASRALNVATRSLVSPDTVERVTVAANALGYRPNYLARSFKTNRTLSVGVVIPDMNNPLFPPMLRGIEDRLSGDGYVALLANTESDLDRQERIFEGMLERKVDGLICATAHLEDPSLEALGDQGLPVVLFNRVAENHAFSSVSVDDAAGIRLAVEHLAALGHRRIAHIAGPQGYSTGLARYRGFLASMRAGGLAVDERLIPFAAGFTIAEGERCTARILGSGAPPTAIVAGNDMQALGSYTAIEQAGLRCPDDISVVGFNDMPFIDRLSPPLTTVRIPHHDVGTRAAELLLERLESPAMPLREVLLAPGLVVRGSTGPAAELVPGRVPEPAAPLS
ncbi:MAG: LacI family DNA-binding transcriptional regulator [Acidimicrobiales bacterium]